MSKLVQALNKIVANKLPTPSEALEDYIKGSGGTIYASDIPKDYYNALQTLLPDKSLTLYRAFESLEHFEEEWSKKDHIGNPFTKIGDQLISFTASESVAKDIASERSEDYGTFGITIEMKVDKKDIYFHHKYDDLGKYYPKEQEVLVLANGYGFKILEQVAPDEKENYTL